MNNPMKSVVAMVMMPMLALLKTESNVLRSILYGVFSFLAIISFYALLIFTAGINALLIYKTYLVAIGMLPSIIVMAYITYLFSGLSRNQLEIKAFVERVIKDSKNDESIDGTHQITVVIMLALAGIFLLIGFIINVIYVFMIGIGFRLMTVSSGIGITVIALTVLSVLALLNSRHIRSAFNSIMKPLANKLHHA